MSVGARELIVDLLQRPDNVLERINLIIKQFLGFYSIIERIVELVGEEFVILQQFVVRFLGNSSGDRYSVSISLKSLSRKGFRY